MEQTSFRLPSSLSRALTQAAAARGVPKSLLVRQALEQFLYPAIASGPEMVVRECSAPYLGSLILRRGEESADPIAGMIRQHNWRD